MFSIYSFETHKTFRIHQEQGMASLNEGRRRAIPTNPSLMFIIVQEILEKAQEISPFDTDQNFELIDEINELSILLEAEAQDIEERSKKLETVKSNKKFTDERPILKFKYRIKDWRKLKKKRKWNYWLFLKNKETCKLYQEWYDTQSKTLPKNLKPKYGKFRYPGETEVRLKYAREQMKHESELMKLKAEDYQRKFKEIDDKMMNLIKTKYKEWQDLVEDLTTVWQEECEHEKKRSESIWIKKETWIRKKAFHYTETIIDQNIQEENPKFRRKAKRKGSGKKNHITQSLKTIIEDQQEYDLIHHELEREIYEEMEQKLRAEARGETFDESRLNYLHKMYDEKYGSPCNSEEEEETAEIKLPPTPEPLRQNTAAIKKRPPSRARLTKNAVKPRNQAEAKTDAKTARKTQLKNPSLRQKNEGSKKDREIENRNENTPDKRTLLVQHQKSRKKLTFN